VDSPEKIAVGDLDDFVVVMAVAATAAWGEGVESLSEVHLQVGELQLGERQDDCKLQHLKRDIPFPLRTGFDCYNRTDN
jgi:hypothetical protein